MQSRRPELAQLYPSRNSGETIRTQSCCFAYEVSLATPEGRLTATRLGKCPTRARRWDEAAAGFREVLQIIPTDGPAQVFLKRCEALRSVSLPADWDGVYKFDTK